MLDSRPGGYLIRVKDDELDVSRFERLFEDGRSELGAGALKEAEETLAAALALWRGPALADLADEPFAEAEARRLEELRLAGVEARLEVALRLGRDAELVGELQSLVAGHPLRERLRAQLMLALYRSGRQADALAVYRDGRRRLVDELGIEPSRELQELEQAILRHEPTLESPTTLAETPAAPATDRAVAAPLPVAVPERRKLVTVVFCDIAGSTALDERLDPEALEVLLDSFFGRVKATVEFHAGTVERGTGSEVMAVFGVPVAHEDDALRACRAAVEMRAALPELGIEGRIGVNSGEVVTGTKDRLAIGDAVNVAARLQQAAQPGEVLVGDATLALVGAAVEAEAVEPLALKGKAEPVPVFRLLSVLEVPWRLPEAPFVGRVDEVALIRTAWRSALVEERCELVTIVGEAGLGKSRLVAEALSGIDARVVQGRCLPYGVGITYWPVVEVVKQLDARPADPAAAQAIGALLGEDGQGMSTEEIAWGFRKLLEQEAPLIVVFEDVHSGEETFLDLVEGVALLCSGAPLLLVCLARPELLDRRGQWPVGLRLEPLSDRQVAELIGGRAPGLLGERIARAAGGNPLFVLEMLAVVDDAREEIVVPPTLRALLAARLDQLEDADRRVLECAAVEGEVFHRGALHALIPEEPQLTPRLAALARRALICSVRAQLPGEDGFRFRHLLLRDAAYNAIPKRRRALLHERCAAWLEEHDSTPAELDELRGYHLEQAYRCRTDLGPPDAGARRLADRAAALLAAAGRRALARGDDRAAAQVLERTLELTRSIILDVHLELDLAASLRQDAPQRAAAIADAAAERARGAGDRAGEALARAVAAGHRWMFDADYDPEEAEALARTALPPLEQAGDHDGLVRVWMCLATVAQGRLQWEKTLEACEQALHHSRLSGKQAMSLPDSLTAALVYGPRPAEQALGTLDGLLPERPPPYAPLMRAQLLAMLGRFEEAWPIALEAHTHARERTGHVGEIELADLARLEGDHSKAAHYLQLACDAFAEQGRFAMLSSYAPLRGRSLCALGRYEEAEPLARQGRELGANDDVMTQMLWRQVQALVDAHRGEHAAAERLVREAVTIGEGTDSPVLQADALCVLAEVLQTAGRIGEATAALEQALDHYERKQNLAMAAQVRPQLEAIRAQSAAT